MMPKKVLGILGGLGPMSSVYFYELLTAHTRACCDQEHLNILLSSRADIPDRTAFIIGASTQNPLPAMQQEVSRLVSAGAQIIAIPCNTAHYFYNGIASCTSVPILNIIEETVRYCQYQGTKKVGVLATEGTVRSGAYQSVMERIGIEFMSCSETDQQVISKLIYEDIKQGRPADPDALERVADSLTAAGCERIILGCTELSLFKKQYHPGPRFVDAMEILALRAIAACGADAVDFDDELMHYYDRKGWETLCCSPN